MRYCGITVQKIPIRKKIIHNQEEARAVLIKITPNQITQMKQRIEKKKLKEMIALQKMQAGITAREQSANDPPPLTTDEIVELFNDSGTSGSSSNSSKSKKKGKPKK